MDESIHAYTDRFRTAFEMTHRKLGHAVLSKLEFDITGPQYFMLFIIKKEGLIKQTQLSDKLGVKPSAITVMIDRLVQNGYVIRKHHETDRRIVLVELTESGDQIVQKAMEVHKEVSAQALSQLSSEELDIFVKSFEKIASYFAVTV